MMQAPSLAAFVISKVMERGSDKDGCDESWKEKPINHHLDRAIRHIITHKLISEGNQPPDGERHLEFAITRLAMALWKHSLH